MTIEEALAAGKKLLDKEAKPPKRTIVYSQGVSSEEWNEMFVEQLGCCAICGRHTLIAGKLVVDHDHETGLVRGLLCTSCNTFLGHIERNPHLAIDALLYLKQHHYSKVK